MRDVKKLFVCCLLTAMKLIADPVLIESEAGANYAVDVDCEDSFRNVIQHISDCVQLVETGAEDANGILIKKLASGPMSVKLNKDEKGGRDYSLLPTEQHQADMIFILTTLADSSLIKIKGSESSLKRAGNRINPIHPLQFLMFIFTNERLKVAMVNIQGRSWVWKEFLKGLTNSLKEESALGNIMPFAEEFANTVSVPSAIILPIMQSEKWENLIDALIKHVPRQPPSKRYDQ